jgi:large subunit ribosomal protein L40e
MVRFPEAEARLLKKQICNKCGASNSIKAMRCRRCKSKELRKKIGASRGVK